MLGNYPLELRSRVHEDLTIRARGGMFIYLATWIVVALWVDMPNSDPTLFYSNLVILCITLILRIAHYRLARRDPHYKVEVMSRVLILLILFSSLHWGVLSAWIFLTNQFPQLLYPFIVILAAFSIGGSTTLSIAKEIRLFYSLLMYIPCLLQGFLFDNNSEFVMLSGLTTLAYLYVLEASRGSSKDYYRAIINGKIAAERASKMEQQSNTDALTQIRNRLYFENRFSEEWKNAASLQIPTSVMMLDLDHFKKINDLYGHAVGDECLRKVARTLEIELRRGTDTIARYGGEEFVILLTNTELETAKKIADRLVRTVSNIQLSKDNQLISISCSIGVAFMIPDHGVDPETLLIAADEAMYRAKDGGRNQWAAA